GGLFGRLTRRMISVLPSRPGFANPEHARRPSTQLSPSAVTARFDLRPHTERPCISTGNEFLESYAERFWTHVGSRADESLCATRSAGPVRAARHAPGGGSAPRRGGAGRPGEPGGHDAPGPRGRRDREPRLFSRGLPGAGGGRPWRALSTGDADGRNPLRVGRHSCRPQRRAAPVDGAALPDHPREPLGGARSGGPLAAGGRGRAATPC